MTNLVISRIFCLGYQDLAFVIAENTRKYFESNGKKLMQSQYEIHTLKTEKNQIQAENIELEMELRRALDEIETLKTIITNQQIDAKIKTVAWMKYRPDQSLSGA